MSKTPLDSATASRRRETQAAEKENFDQTQHGRVKKLTYQGLNPRQQRRVVKAIQNKMGQDYRRAVVAAGKMNTNELRGLFS